MLIIAGLNLSNLKPRVWDPVSPYFIPNLHSVMVSYADYKKMPKKYLQAMKFGLHHSLGVQTDKTIYLDNGAFYFSRADVEVDQEEYILFVEKAQPDWHPISQDYIPHPKMSKIEQGECFTKTMINNLTHRDDGFAPVIHISSFLREYICAIQNHSILDNKPSIALGGIVPNLLRSNQSRPHKEILDNLIFIRDSFADKHLHLFGVGGTATIHIAALLGIDSVDSSGWRNRAARGIIQLPGSGDRVVSELGNWRGRKLDSIEEELLRNCQCPACAFNGLAGLKQNGIEGFCNRATHNLWILIQESIWIEEHLMNGTYKQAYKEHIINSTYKPIIDEIVDRTL